MITNVDALTYAGNPANLAGVAEQYGERYEFYNADICRSRDRWTRCSRSISSSR